MVANVLFLAIDLPRRAGLGLRLAMRPVLTVAVLAAAGPARRRLCRRGLRPAEDAARGKYGDHLYGQYCLSCHGANAGGRMNQASDVDRGRARSRAGAAERRRAVAARRGCPRRGLLPPHRLHAAPPHRPAAPPRAALPQRPSDSRARRLRRELRRAADPEAEAGARQRLAGPRSCSRSTARAATRSSRRAESSRARCRRPLVDATPLQVAEAVRIGPYVMPKFSQRDLTDRQLDSIVALRRVHEEPGPPAAAGGSATSGRYPRGS